MSATLQPLKGSVTLTMYTIALIIHMYTYHVSDNTHV